jgi:hypothetical protein
MPDFTAWLSRPAGKAVRPPPLPVEMYAGKVQSYEYGDNNTNKTPYVRYQLSLTEWPEDVPEEKRVFKDREGNEVPINLQRVRLRRDFYLTDDALWRLDEFLRSCDIEPEGHDYGEVCPQAVGCNVTIEVQQYLNRTTNELGNQVGQVFGPNEDYK